MRRAVLFTLLSAILFGSTFPAIRFGLQEGNLGPLSFAAYRFFAATATMVLYAALRRRIRLPLFRDPAIFWLAALVTVAYVLQFVAQDQTTASKASLLINIHVVTVAILGYVFLGERHGWAMFFAVLLGLVGTFLISTNGDVDAIRPSNAEFRGDALAFLSGLCWAAYTVSFKRVLTRHPATDGVAFAVPLFTWITLLLAPAAAATEGLRYQGNATGLGMILYLGVVATGAAFLLWQEGLRHIQATASSLLLLVEIVVALSISAAYLGERLGAAGALGALAIMAAAFLAGRDKPGIPTSVEPFKPRVTRAARSVMRRRESAGREGRHSPR